MTAHRTTAVRRGEGFAAQCETCGSVTFGGFRTKAEARNALAHENAPEAAPTANEGESESRANGSQQAVPTPIKEQNAMPILSSPADTSNDWLTPALERQLRRYYVDLGISQDAIDAAAGYRDDRDKARQRLAEAAPLLDQLDAGKRSHAEFLIVTLLDQSIAHIVRPYVPAFPAPDAIAVPIWAEVVDDPEWDADDQAWERTLRWSRRFPEGGGVRMTARHVMDHDGSVTVDCPDIYVDMESIETAEEARAIAGWLREAADALDEPTPAQRVVRMLCEAADLQSEAARLVAEVGATRG